MISHDQIQHVIGSTLYDNDGDRIGKVGQVFLDDQTGRPEWVTVNTGLFGTNESFVPIAEASFTNGETRVPFSKAQVKDAPNVSADQGHLSEQEEAELYRYYGLAYSDAGAAGEVGTDRDLAAGRPYDTTDTTDDTTDDTTVTTATPSTGAGFAADRTDYAAETGRTVGRDTSGPTTDDAMTRSEEQVRVGTEKVETGRARLRKYVVTDDVQQTVPVTHEEVRVEREPITEANRDRATSGPDLSEEEHEVVLTEERPVVQKETVPVERVRLTKDQDTREETVSEQVRREHIDTDDLGGDRGDSR